MRAQPLNITNRAPPMPSTPLRSWHWPQHVVADAIVRIRHITLEDGRVGPKQRIGSTGEFYELSDALIADLSSAEINHRLDWASVGLSFQTRSELWLITERNGGQLSSAVVLPAPISTLDYALGPWTFFRWPIRKFQIYRGPLSQADARSWQDMLKVFAANMPRWSACFVSAVPVDSSICNAMQDSGGDIRRHYFVLPWGKVQPHCRIKWEGSTESYLSTLGRESRRNLRRYSKQLFDDDAIRCRVRRFEREDDLCVFLRDASCVFANSYQSRVPGLRLTQDSTEAVQIATAARHQAFLGHVLYIDDEPAAFHHGVVIGDCYFVLQMAYDERWARRQVGGALFLAVLKDIELRGPKVRFLDYMGGVTLFKLRTTNEKTQTQSFYLFPRSVAGALQYGTLRAVNSVSQFAGAALARGGLRASAETLLKGHRAAAGAIKCEKE